MNLIRLAYNLRVKLEFFLHVPWLAYVCINKMRANGFWLLFQELDFVSWVFKMWLIQKPQLSYLKTFPTILIFDIHYSFNNTIYVINQKSTFDLSWTYECFVLSAKTAKKVWICIFARSRHCCAPSTADSMELKYISWSNDNSLILYLLTYFGFCI